MVVVSAMSGITNFLVGVCANLPAGRESALDTFRKKHMAVAESMFSGERLALFTKEFDARFKVLSDLLNDDDARENDRYY